MKSSVESELVWFFDDARGALGVHGMNLDPQSKSVGLAPEGISENARYASIKYRKIDAAYSRLSRRDKLVLWFAYQPIVPAYAQLVGVFGKLGPCALALHPLQYWQDMFCKVGKKSKSHKALADIKNQITAMHSCALKAFKKARAAVDQEAEEMRRLKALQWVLQ